MNVAVIGSGSWGTALAQLLATSGHHATLWARRDDVVASINDQHVNPRYLSDVTLSQNVTATTSLQACVEGAVAIVMVTPSHLIREFAKNIAPFLSPETPVVVCSKGVEAGTGKLPAEVIADEIGNPARIAVLSGPNHAEEVVKGIASGTVVACEDEAVARFFQELFSTETFRVYTSDDVIGVELCAASKNVIAIAIGIAYGLGYGDNTAAMLMTRGQAEMSRLVSNSGGQAITCMGLAGTGDLIATCMSRHSRNRKLGLMIAQDKTLDDFTVETHMVAEGALACKNLRTLAERNGVELPIADAVSAMVWEGASPKEVARVLAERPLKQEFYGL